MYSEEKIKSLKRNGKKLQDIMDRDIKTCGRKNTIRIREYTNKDTSAGLLVKMLNNHFIHIVLHPKIYLERNYNRCHSTE